MFWADRIAREIIASGQFKPYHVDDMFTPSGFAHIGSLRGPLIHDLLTRTVKDAGGKVVYTFVFNDFDPIDGLPDELKGKFDKYLGFPLRTTPSPKAGFASFGEYFAQDLKQVLASLGMNANYLSSWNMYKEGKFNEAIKIALDDAEKIQDIYQSVSGSKKREKGWLPLQVICEECGRIGTTRVFNWDGKTVAYKCEPDLVRWARGCGHEARTSPFDGRGKLPWKVDWPAHWAVLGVTIEGAGKDHSSAGGSRDIARALCKEVFRYPEPYNLPYEFFLLGGRKMSSSRGVGLKARDLTNLLPASVARFLFTRTDYRQTIEFDPEGTMAIPDLFDEYDRAWRAYIDGSDENLSRVFELSQIGSVPGKDNLFLPRFRDIANYLQLPNVDLQVKFVEVKGSDLTASERKILEERAKYARVWLDTYAPDGYKTEISEELPEAVKTLTGEQKKYLLRVVDLLKQESDPEGLQLALYDLAKEMHIPAKDAFGGIYKSLVGKEFGPKAAWFLLQYSREKVLERLEKAAK